MCALALGVSGDADTSTVELAANIKTVEAQAEFLCDKTSDRLAPIVRTKGARPDKDGGNDKDEDY